MEGAVGTFVSINKRKCVSRFSGECFLPNSKFSLADSIDFTSKFSENMFFCAPCVWLRLVPELGSGKDFTVCLFVLLEEALSPEVPSKGLR